MIDTDTLHQEINKYIDEACPSSPNILGDHTIRIPSGKLHSIVEMMINRFDCRHLSGITAQMRNQSDEIELLYHFWVGSSFSLLVSLPRNKPKISEITSLLPGADFYEREAAEMFGIEFVGREDMPPLLLPDDWDEGPPFLKSEVNNE
jgi:NADH:ubiquinone oxidoreductase subunit C